MSRSDLGRETILAVGAACGEPVRRALDELLDIFQQQVEQDHAHELAKKIRRQYGQAPDVYSVEDCADLIDPEVTSG